MSIHHAITEAEDTVTELVTAEYLSRRALPTSPDLRYEPAEAPKPWFINLVTKIQAQIKRGDPIPSDPGALHALYQYIVANFTGEGVDDRLHGFTDVLDALSKCDPNSPTVTKVNDAAITLLYQTLPHPPASYVGPSEFRRPDGSGNNILWPNIGKAGEPYSRSVQNSTPAPAHELPDPGLVFDVLLKRRYDPSDGNNIHKGGQSALTFAFASIVTHSLFRTNLQNPLINDTSSYLDLSPLYGCNSGEQAKVRLLGQDEKLTGYGKLYPDCFSEERLAFLPPAVSALLVVFNRNHNYIADMLYKINEKGNWKDPNSLNSILRTKQDEQIFQTARLVNCGHFMTMIFSDYVAGFLGQTRNGESWHLKPFDAMRRADGTTVERGQGNHVSVEFNLLYRWHATISGEDEKWTQQAFQQAFNVNEAQGENMPPMEFVRKAASVLENAEQDPTKRTFGGLVRGADGSFADNDLAKILQDATATPAQRYGARGTPGILKPVEVLAMFSARKYGVCTMNDFRKFLGLEPFKSFEAWNSDPQIANAARSLYKHIDRLELYPGIQAEENLPMTYGSGFMCGYTLMRAILADAISLVRGDRFFTTDFTPTNLTSWGFQDCQSVPDNGAWGANLPKLLMRHLPNNYSYNSVYGLFPFFTPEAMKVNLSNMKVLDQFDFTKPTPGIPTKVVKTLKAIKTVFNDNTNFKVTYTENMNDLTQKYGFFLVFDDDKRHQEDKALCMRALWPTEESLKEYAEFYKRTTIELINEHSFKYDLPAGSAFEGRYCDIVRNVINITSVRWAADYLIGLSLKNKKNPTGLFLETEVYDMLMVLFMCVFENVLPEHGWQLKVNAEAVGKIINETIERSLKQVMPGYSYVLDKFASHFQSNVSISGKPCHAFLQRLAASGRDLKSLTACVIGLAVGSSVNYAQACAQVVDFYLDDARVSEREHIVQLVQRTDAESTDLLVGYIKEGQRLAPQFPGLLRKCVSKEPIVIDQGNGLPSVTINGDDVVWASYYDAQTDPNDFPDPMSINPRRPRNNYAVQAVGFHGCPGVSYTEKTMVEVIRVIFSLRNLRRAPAPSGTLSSFPQAQFGTNGKLFLDDSGNISPWPGCLMVVWDE